jgi:hypothetical protein
MARPRKQPSLSDEAETTTAQPEQERDEQPRQEPVKQLEIKPKVGSIPNHKNPAYIQWHRECHIPHAHYLWCKEHGVPFQPQTNEL